VKLPLITVAIVSLVGCGPARPKSAIMPMPQIIVCARDRDTECAVYPVPSDNPWGDATVATNWVWNSTTKRYHFLTGEEASRRAQDEWEWWKERMRKLGAKAKDRVEIYR
jgi:hypothetical protein